MTDCLIIGFNDGNLQEYVNAVRSMGHNSGAYKDLQLAIIYYQGKPYRATDILNHFHWNERGLEGKPFHNADFLWPVITYLGTYLHRRGIKFDYVNLFHLEKEKLKEKLLTESILSIAITTTLYVSPEPIFEIVSFIRQHNQTAKIIVGGPFISNQAKSDQDLLEGLFAAIGADFYVISSEGEATLAELILALKTGTGVENISNLSYRSAGRYVFNALKTESNSLEDNMVNYRLFPYAETGPFITTRTAKSCPFSCAFCGFPQRAGQYTYMSVEAVERELNSLRELGSVTTLTFIDDTFNVPKARFKEILRMMIRNKYEFKWNCLYRSDHGDEEAIELMGKARCEGVFLGVESGSDRMLQKMNKSARRKDYLKAIPLLRNAGISTYASLIVGFPGETYDTVEETISLMEEAKPEYFRAQLWYCDPVTPIWKRREELSIKGSGFQWSHSSMDVKTACVLIDRMFLCVDGAIWLPQFGFEQWSTFYLQRRGMSVEQIHEFLRSFNGVIKERLLNPHITAPSPELMERLKSSCRFDEPPGHRETEIYSASSYKEAESFWTDEFSRPFPPLLASIQFSIPDSEAVWEAVPLNLPEQALSRTHTAQEGFANFLAALCTCFSDLVAARDISVLSGIQDANGKRVLPLRISWSEDSPQKEIVDHIRRKAALAEKHNDYARYILSSPTIMNVHHGSPPRFEAGYIFVEDNVSSLEKILMDFEEINNLGLALVIRIGDRQINSYFVCQPSHFNMPMLKKLADAFVARCGAIFGNIHAPSTNLCPENDNLPVTTDVDLVSERTFNFEFD